MNKVAALVLAAGKGTRMKSRLPKVLHKVGGKAMVERVLDTVNAVGVDRSVVIVGFGGEEVRAYLGDRCEYVTQAEQKGTGHAVREAKPVLGDFDGTIVLMCGDTPLVTEDTIKALLNEHAMKKAKCFALWNRRTARRTNWPCRKSTPVCMPLTVKSFGRAWHSFPMITHKANCTLPT